MCSGDGDGDGKWLLYACDQWVKLQVYAQQWEHIKIVIGGGCVMIASLRKMVWQGNVTYVWSCKSAKSKGVVADGCCATAILQHLLLIYRIVATIFLVATAILLLLQLLLQLLLLYFIMVLDSVL